MDGLFGLMVIHFYSKQFWTEKEGGSELLPNRLKTISLHFK